MSSSDWIKYPYFTKSSLFQGSNFHYVQLSLTAGLVKNKSIQRFDKKGIAVFPPVAQKWLALFCTTVRSEHDLRHDKADLFSLYLLTLLAVR